MQAIMNRNELQERRIVVVNDLTLDGVVEAPGTAINCWSKSSCPELASRNAEKMRLETKDGSRNLGCRHLLPANISAKWWAQNGVLISSPVALRIPDESKHLPLWRSLGYDNTVFTQAFCAIQRSIRRAEKLL